MKRFFLSCFGLVTILCSQAVGADPASNTATNSLVSAEKTSFKEVTSQLDPGGNLYMYLGTAQWLEGLSAKVYEFRGIVGSIPDLPEEARENIEKGFKIATNLIKSSGLEDLSGVGVSSIAREKGYYHSKFFLHHYPGRGSGFFWNLFGQKSHSLAALDLLSTNTALATFSDVDVPLLWSVLQKQAKQSGFSEVEELFDAFPEHFERATGLKWDQVLASLGGEYGFVLSLNPAKKVKIPLHGGDSSIEFPEPALMIVAKTKDDTLFNRINELLEKTGQSVVRLDKPNLKLRSIPLPLPLPMPVVPTIASSGGYLFVASSEVIVQDALAVKAGEVPGLKSTAEFQRLAQDIPVAGNQFTFISERFGRTITDLQRSALESSEATDAQKEWVNSFLDKHPGTYFYTVGGNTEQGWITVANGNQHPGALFLASAVAPTAIMAAVALPALAKAKSKAQQVKCVNNLRQIDRAKKDWALEKNKPDDATPKESDLLPFLKLKQFPVCPAGGDYTINPVSERPECSIDGHVLP